MFCHKNHKIQFKKLSLNDDCFYVFFFQSVEYDAGLGSVFERPYPYPIKDAFSWNLSYAPVCRVSLFF